MNKNNVYLSKKEMKNFIDSHKKIGEGTDGVCLRDGKKVYKIYHKTFEELREKPKVRQYDIDGVRLYDKGDFNIANMALYDNRLIKYIDKEGTKINVEQGLREAIDRGNRVKNTRLPQGIIFVDNKARGCIYPYYPHTKSIYHAVNRFYKTRLNICKSILDLVKELVDNNIYSVDLSQKNPDNPYDKGYANVLLQHNKPIIIDLDGKSALYTDEPNKNFERITCVTLTDLLFEIITRQDIQGDRISEDFDAIRDYLMEYGLSSELVDKYIEQDYYLEDVEESLKHFEAKRRH